MNTQSMFFEYLRTRLGLFSLPSQIPSTIAAAPATMVSSSVVNPAFTPGVPVNGYYYFALQSSGIASGDQFAIETSNDGVAWTAAPSPVPNPVVANSTYQFTGVYAYIRARKTAGTGTASVITLMARA